MPVKCIEHYTLDGQTPVCGNDMVQGEVISGRIICHTISSEGQNGCPHCDEYIKIAQRVAAENRVALKDYHIATAAYYLGQHYARDVFKVFGQGESLVYAVNLDPIPGHNANSTRFKEHLIKGMNNGAPPKMPAPNTFYSLNQV